MAETKTWKDLMDVWEGVMDKHGEDFAGDFEYVSLGGAHVGSGSVNMRGVYLLIKEALERGDIKADDETDEALLGEFFRRASGLGKGLRK